MNDTPSCLVCLGTQIVNGEPCRACASPDGLAQLEMLANPTTDEQQRELATLEREALDAICAISAALQLGLISFAGLSHVQGKPLVELSVMQGGKSQMMRFPGPSVVDAFLAAGKEVHTQLMMVHTKRPIPWYVTSVATRQKVRNPPKIITSPN